MELMHLCLSMGMTNMAAGMAHAALGTSMRLQHAAVLETRKVNLQRQKSEQVEVGHFESIQLCHINTATK